MAVTPRTSSRIIALREELGRSQADLESASEQYASLASSIPSDLTEMSGRLSRILNAAAAEADAIRSEAHRFAETTRIEAEEHAASIMADAERELKLASELRAETEAQSKKARSEFARIREESVRHASEIYREAESQAEKLLTRAHQDIEQQLAAAQHKLDNLSRVRDAILATVQHFYEKFNALDRTLEQVDTAQTLAASSVAHDSEADAEARDIHVVTEVVVGEVLEEPLDGVG